MRKVLITGGSGYVGQYLVCGLAKEYEVFYTFSSTEIEFEVERKVRGFKVDFTSGEGLEECLTSIGCLDAIVNCAAIAVPGACEKDPDLARAVNVPIRLLEYLLLPSCPTGSPVFVHLSTDQVYDGSKPYWKETDEAAPINVYGKSKIEAEYCIQVKSLRSGQMTKFFQDEYRNAVYVMDVINIIATVLRSDRGTMKHKILNMGGPERLSRVDMAWKVAEHLGLDGSLIEAVPSASVPRAAPSPLDISMDLSRLKELDVKLTPFEDALKMIYNS